MWLLEQTHYPIGSAVLNPMFGAAPIGETKCICGVRGISGLTLKLAAMGMGCGRVGNCTIGMNVSISLDIFQQVLHCNLEHGRRWLPYMTSTEEGGARNAANLRTNSAYRFCRQRGGEGQISQNSVDVIYGSPLRVVWVGNEI